MKRHPLFRAAWLVVLTSVLTAPSYAQTRDLAFERVVRGRILDIEQDDRGYLWLATGEGLIRYDGYRTAVYRHDPDDPTSLSDDWIECLYLDRDGILWAGTFGHGLNRFDPETGRATRFEHDPNDARSLSHDTVYDIVEDDRGRLWVGTHDGLNRFDRTSRTFTRYRHEPNDSASLTHDHVRTLYVDRRGTLWVGTGSPWHHGPRDGGLNRYVPETDGFVRYVPDPDDPVRLLDGRIGALFEDSRGTFWVGTWGDGLHTLNRATGRFTRYRYDPNRPDRLSRPHLRQNAPSFSGVSFIAEEPTGVLWIGGLNGGLNRYDPQTGALSHAEYEPEDPRSLSDNAVWTAHVARDETLWIGTFGGLNTLIRTPVQLPLFELPGANGLVLALQEGAGGTLWIGTEYGGLYRYDRASETFTNYRHDPSDPRSLSQGAVDVVHQDRRGILWIGTQSGLNRLHPDSAAFTRYVHDPEDPTTLSGNNISEIYEDRRGRLWIGTMMNGLNLFDRTTGTVARYRHESGDSTSLSSNHVRNVHEELEGTLWVSTNQGLNRFDPSTGRFTRFRHEPDDPNSLISDNVRALREDRDGNLWIGTANGLDRFDAASERFTHFTPENSALPTSGIGGVLPDDRGRIWMVSAYIPSVIRLDPERRTVRTYEDKVSAVRWAGRSDNALVRSARGELLIGRVNSFYAFHPENVDEKANPHPPQIAVTVRSDAPGRRRNPPIDRPLRDGEHVRFSHGDNSFTLTVSALHYVDSEENQYLYRLEDYDETWRGPGTERTATYYNVPDGDYVFRARASNSDGVWTEEGVAIRLTVLPPWWQTWWAYGGYLLVVLLAAGAATFAQRRYLRRKERERARARELEHAREIARMNEDLREHEEQLEAQNAVLESQKARLEAQKQRLEELDAQKSRFFANLSHEFRTPLTLILGPLKDLLGDRYGELDPDVWAPLALMERSARRLVHLIDQLLDLASLEHGGMQLEKKRMDLVAFLRSLVLEFAGRAEREGVDLSFSSEPSYLPTRFDPDKLEKVVSNLVSNALKFTPPDGKVRVSLEDSGEEVLLTVKDTGGGIPEAQRSHVFDRFYQGDPSARRPHGGAGIGLALAKELIELHGGEISVESEEGFGTSFRIRLPIETEAPAGKEERSAPARSPEIELPEAILPGEASDEYGPLVPRPNEPSAPDHAPDHPPDNAPDDAPLILVVEDDADMRAYLEGHLRSRYRVHTAEDGEEGLREARSRKPDLVLADIMMPKLDGNALCRTIKSEPDLEHVPVVLITARADLESKLEGLESGADAYLTKPFSAEELLIRMENLIDIRSRLRRRSSDDVRLGPSEIDVSSQEAAFLERVREVVEGRMGEARFGVAELAEEVGISQRQLLRRLRESVDMSPAAYIRMMRIERATQLLERDAGLVSEIAYEVGFKNADHFSSLFKQVVGVAPSRYRESMTS